MKDFGNILEISDCILDVSIEQKDVIFLVLIIEEIFFLPNAIMFLHCLLILIQLEDHSRALALYIACLNSERLNTCRPKFSL